MKITVLGECNILKSDNSWNRTRHLLHKNTGVEHELHQNGCKFFKTFFQNFHKPVFLTLRRPLRNFLKKKRFKPFQISFFSGFFISSSYFESDFFKPYSNEWDRREKTMFIHTNQPLITSFYIKTYLFFAELAMSQRWSAIFCATGAWGGKPIGRLRVNIFQ